MSRTRKLLRHLLASDTPEAGAERMLREVESRRTARELAALNRQVAQLRGLIYQQSDLTVEALRRAGWQSDDEAAQQVGLHRTLHVVKARGDVIAGPWTGEVGFELLYWIPFLNWLVDQGLDPRRLVVVSRGGAAAWYRHLTSRYVDILDVLTPEEFRRGTEGKKKQYNERHEFDRQLIERARQKLGLAEVSAVHPASMFRLFVGLWRKRTTIDLIQSFTSYRPLSLPLESAEPALDGIPADYVAAKFYFSKAFPDSSENRRFVAELLQRVSRRVPVVLLSTAVRLDEHHDFRTAGGSGLFVVDAHQDPRTNLERQTRVICAARGFIGTYGGFSYLAPFYGVRSVSFFSRRRGFEDHHLELANRVFDALLPGGFLALDRRAGDLVEPAVERWASVVGARTSPAGADALT